VQSLNYKYLISKMLPTPQSTLDKIKQTEFYKAKVKEAFNIIDADRKGYVDRR
jgi:hypothetical protein